MSLLDQLATGRRSSPAISTDEEGNTQAVPLPKVKFTYRFDPMSIVVEERYKPFWEFIVSLCAIIGGLFSIFGILDALLFAIVPAQKRKRFL